MWAGSAGEGGGAESDQALRSLSLVLRAESTLWMALGRAVGD